MRNVALLALAFALLLWGCGGDDTASKRGGSSGAAKTEPEADEVAEAARAAGCELRSFRGTSREHVSDPEAKVQYSSSPPTSGKHFEIAAEDGAYPRAPDAKALVHSLEHGRVVIWFQGDLPARVRADLRASYDEDSFQTLLTPDETGSQYAVAATAWNRDPVPNGTGRLLGCRNYTPEVLDALEAFKKRHRSQGPEAIP